MIAAAAGADETGARRDHWTAAIAETVAGMSYQHLDAETVSAVKRLIMDGIAVAVAGSCEPAPAIVAEHVRQSEAKPEATVWGYGYKSTAQQAAYCNAVSMHVLDFEPMSSPPTHAVSPTVPAALALAEALGASGREVIAACAKGFEMQGRVLLASGHARGSLLFHTPGIVGVMGSTVAASHLLELDSLQIAHALGIAASRCAGLPANTGSMVKCTHCGNAAAAGVEAALLARRGFTANPGIFEAGHGYVETFFPNHFDYHTLLDFGRPYQCVNPGMAIKFFPSKYPTHFAIAAALEVRSAIGDVSRIGELRIVTPDIADADRAHPRSGLEGKFSFQYTAAAALLDGHVVIESFSDERRYRADMVRLLEKTRVMRDPNRSRDTRSMRVDVEVVMDDGVTHHSTCRAPPGAWGQRVDPARHHEKMRECLSVRLDPVGQAFVIGSLTRLEESQPHELAGLMSVLSCARG